MSERSAAACTSDRLPERRGRAEDPEVKVRHGQEVAEDLIGLMHKIRNLDLKKTPSISETLDWARALIALNAGAPEEELVKETMNVILKYEADIRKAQQELSRMMSKPVAQPAAPAAPAEPRKKGTLH
jgi:hypothetical protein